MKRLLTLVAFFATLQASAQQVNPVPDYVFRNQMSVGRSTVTDTAAYFSIGPRYGAVKGLMPPIVVDTASFSGSKRNGLLIFSVQKNKFLYWDSVRVQWSDMAGSSGSYIVAGDTASMLAPYLRKADTTAMLSPYVRHAGYGLTKSGQSFLVDTLNIATRAWRQKGLDSLAALEVSGSGTTNYIPKFTASSTIGNSQIFDNGTNVGIGTASPGVKLDIVGSAGTIVRTKGGTGSAQGSAYYVQLAGSTNTLSAFGDRANIFGGTVDQIASIYTGSGIPLTFDVNAAERLRITSTGDVGIGTASPISSSVLDIVSSTNIYPRIRSTGTGEAFQFYQNSTSGTTAADGLFVGINSGNDAFFYNAEATPARFFTSATERLRIFANGRVGINTTTDAGYQLDINGTLRSVNGANFATTSGEVLIGTTTDAGDYKLQVSGNIYNTGSAVLAATSGEAYIGTTSDAGNYKLQVSGQAFIRNTGTSGALYLDSTSLSIDEVKNRHAILISGHSLTGAEIQGPIYVGTNWNTSSDVSAIEVALTNTASGANSNLMKLSDGTNTFRVTKDAEVVTAAPTGGSIRKWKLGEAATVSPTSPNRTIRVEIDGTVYYLHAKTTND